MSTERTWTVRKGADLGAALAELRGARGVTQAELASSLQFDRTYLARIENGLTSRLLDRVIRGLRRLGAEVTVSWTIESDD